MYYLLIMSIKVCDRPGSLLVFEVDARMRSKVTSIFMDCLAVRYTITWFSTS